MNERQDIHAPKNFDPADYVVIDYIDNRRPEYYFGMTMDAYEAITARWQAEIFKHFPDWRTGGEDHTSIFQCNHCGHPGIRYVAVVKHIPSGKLLAFGEQCAERCDLDGRDAFRLKFIKDRAAKQAAAEARFAAKQKFAQENPEVVAFLNTVSEQEVAYRDSFDNGTKVKAPHPFLLDMVHALNRYDSLTERQVAAVEKFAAKAAEFAARDAERQAEREAELANTGPLPEGRYDISGTIISTKWQSSQFGDTPKMLVKMADGNKVWGTVPEAAFTYDAETGTTTTDDMKGREVSFAATVERSQDDEHFGFFKRPSKFQYTDTKEVAAA